MHTKTLSAQRDVVAPDGSDVRLLVAIAGGGMAHFELGPGETAIAIKHRTVEEIWYFLTGRGQMWRMAEDGDQSIVDVGPGVSIAIPLGTTFQFRAFGFEALSAIGVTMPPWPGGDEAIPAEGPWTPTVAAGES
jgi:mannose-6-phosphate isomerase-like protein (cupin superfamily)